MNDRHKAIAGLFIVACGAAWWARRSSAAIATTGEASSGALWSFEFQLPAMPAFVEAVTTTGADVVSSIAQTVTGTGWDIPARGEQYRAAIYAAEDANGIPRLLLARLLYQESRFRQDIITGATRSAVGALGIAQFMPATAAELRIDPLDPAQAIPAAGKYLGGLYRQFGDWRLALAAYNWGMGNVARRGLAAAPLETQNYVAQIAADVALA